MMNGRIHTNDDEQANVINILKTRDDPEPVFFQVDVDGEYRLHPDTSCTWLKGGDDELTPEKLRPRIEPWLTALFQSEHLSLLVGSGLTHSVYQMAKKRTLPVMAKASFRVFESEINAAATASAIKAGRGKSNIEDQFRVANELLSGLQIYCSPSATFRGSKKLRKQIEILRDDIKNALDRFTASILEGERGIISASKQERENAFRYLISFLMSFASRSGTRDRLHVFTTNYDRLIEAGAEVAGIHLVDRFVGTLAPVFRSSRLNIDMHYNPPGIRGEPRYLEGVVRFSKLHGSIDWIYVDHVIRRIGIPFGADSADPYFKAEGVLNASVGDLMIYPNSAKDRETAAYPYVELFRDFAAAVCRPNTTLITYGYSFSDEHINRVIEDMLTIPSTHLVIISYDDPMDRIMNTYNKVARPAQITLLIGDHLGKLNNLVDHYLPKPAIDRTTLRMAELLSARFTIAQMETIDGKRGEET